MNNKEIRKFELIHDSMMERLGLLNPLNPTILDLIKICAFKDIVGFILPINRVLDTKYIVELLRTIADAMELATNEDNK